MNSRSLLSCLSMAALLGACGPTSGSGSAPDDGRADDPDAGDGTRIDAGPDDPFFEPGYVPSIAGFDLRCKLISGDNIDDPTENNTHTRANLRGTDLGIPVVHGEDLYIFFGDTAGANTIWPLGPESLPDAVGYSAVPYDQVKADPSVLCSQLRFLTTGGATGPVESDFAAGHMNPPPGKSISEFIKNPSGVRGANAFPNLPGDFEVPSGAFSVGNSIYLFYTIINHEPFEMRGSYLAKWSAPSTSGLPNYDILHHVDQRFTAGGPMNGDFINIAALVEGEYVYMYGTGKYRASNVHLARKKLSEIEEPGGYERYNRELGQWVAANQATPPLFNEPTPNIGEMSVRYFPEIDRYMMMAQEFTDQNRLMARFAEAPEGPWSAPVQVATMSDPGFRDRFCCNGTDCSGERLFECQHAGYYSPYMLPDVELNGDGSFSVSFTMSTWIPYNVALMKATFE